MAARRAPGLLTEAVPLVSQTNMPRASFLVIALLFPAARLLPAALVLPLGCKDVTSEVVSKAVQAGKDTASGIAEGIDEGRKSGSSTDGALVISKLSELEPHGALQVRPGADNELELIVDNRSDRPLRLTKLDALALDPEGFAIQPTQSPSDMTVPARAKDKAKIVFPAEGKKLAKLRVWGEDLEVGVR